METHPIDVLLRAEYDSEYPNLKKLVIIIRHRGAANDEKKIEGSKVIKVTKEGFTYAEQGKETFIPAHRILRVDVA